MVVLPADIKQELFPCSLVISNDSISGCKGVEGDGSFGSTDILDNDIKAGDEKDKNKINEYETTDQNSFLSLSHSEHSFDGATETSKFMSFDTLADIADSRDFDSLSESNRIDNTQNNSDLVCVNSRDLFEEVFSEKRVPEEEEISPSTPPPSRLPLLTSTPHQLSRTRVSSTPCVPPSPLLTSYLGGSGDLSQSQISSPDGPLSLPSLASSGPKSYDYLLKVLLVGDSDVGKQEILSGLEEGSVDSPYCSSTGAAYKTTIILIDGKRVKLQLWDTSGQGRFCTIIRSYSRGAQGILLVYDITNKWSFEGMDRWVKEVEEHAPGIPKVLVGNRLHLAFKRQVDQVEAENYAERNQMGFYEVSPLVNFNITESFQELCRMALKRNGMERLWRSNRVLSLTELCTHTIVARTNVYGIDKLPLPDTIKANLKSYALTTNQSVRPNYRTLVKDRKKKNLRPPDAVNSKCANVSRKSCVIS